MNLLDLKVILWGWLAGWILLGSRCLPDVWIAVIMLLLGSRTMCILRSSRSLIRIIFCYARVGAQRWIRNYKGRETRAFGCSRSASKILWAVPFKLLLLYKIFYENLQFYTHYWSRFYPFILSLTLLNFWYKTIIIKNDNLKY